MKVIGATDGESQRSTGSSFNPCRVCCRRGGAANISSIADMQRFVEAYPELKSKGLAVGKHVALMTEMAQTIEARREWPPSATYEAVRDALGEGAIHEPLVCL